MKKIAKQLIGLVLLLCALNTTIEAQKIVNTDFIKQMNNAFSALDKSKVPTGLLLDYALELTDLNSYNGTLTDTNKVNKGILRDIYTTIVFSAVHKNAGGLWHPDYIDNIWQSQRQSSTSSDPFAPSTITLGGVFYKYSRLKDNAVTGGLVTISNKKIKDKYVKGVWQNPYQQQTTFAMAPAIHQYAGRLFKVIMPSNLWLTNNASSVKDISIDFNDGNGYRNITAGQSVFISYVDTGTKAWVYQLSLTNGTKLYSHSDVYISPEPWTSKYAPIRKSKIGLFDVPIETTIISVTADEAYDGVYAQGYMTINYASSTGKLTRPLIVAEGFDSRTVTNPEDKFGENTFNTFYNDVQTSGSSLLPNVLQGGFGNQQYDIIYVDWKNGVDYLERNALLLEKVIKLVNEQKVKDGCTTPNVVLGQSMGGVIARYALKDIEDKQLRNSGLPHQTSLYISWDAPHQGANVPLSYQHLGRHAGSLYAQSNVPILLGNLNPAVALQNQNSLGLIDFPGSRELLINRIDANHNLENKYHDDWIAKLKAKGYPQQCRKIAVSNGSECAFDQGYQPGASLLSLSGSVNTRFLSDLIMFNTPFYTSSAIAYLFNKPVFAFLGILPGKSSLNAQFELNAAPSVSGSRIYHGKITYTKKLLWLINITTTYTDQSYYALRSVLPTDNTQGGYYDAGSKLGDLNTNSSSLGTIAQWLIKYNVTSTNIPHFNFVPTTSALDIGGQSNKKLTMTNYTTKYIGSLPPKAPYNTPFDNFITAHNIFETTSAGVHNDNEKHIKIASRNGDWVGLELKKLITPTRWDYPKANCTDLCDKLTISGPTNLYNTGIYSVNVKDPKTTVYWTADPLSCVSFSSRTAVNPTITFNGSCSNPITLIAVISACGETQQIERNVTIGNLKIVFGKLTAKQSKKTVLVNWTTVDESFVKSFTVQRSLDWGTNYTDIANITAKGSNNGNSYSYVDLYPSLDPKITNCYRIKIVNKDGSSSYSPVSICKMNSSLFRVSSVKKVINFEAEGTAKENNLDSPSLNKANNIHYLGSLNKESSKFNSNVIYKPFTLYPNPCRDKITISGSHIASIQVIDNIGRIVSVHLLKDVTNPTLSLHTLFAGIYRLRIQTTDGKVTSANFIKE